MGMGREDSGQGDLGGRAVTIRERIADLDPEMLVLDPEGLDVAIIGVADSRVVYDTRRLIEALMEVHEWDYEDASEWFDFNILGAWMGEKTPIYMSRFDDE